MKPSTDLIVWQGSHGRMCGYYVARDEQGQSCGHQHRTQAAAEACSKKGRK